MKKLKKIPVQIYLDPEQQRIISLLSKTSGKSKAAIIRSCISNFIANLPLEKDPALNIMNLGASGEKDIAEKHDDYTELLRRSRLTNILWQQASR